MPTNSKSKTQTIYGNYLAKWHAEHTNIVQPATIAAHDLKAIATDARKNGKLITAACRYWGKTGEVYQMPNDQVIEIALANCMLWDCIAVFGTYADWSQYDQPMTYKRYFEF